MLGKKSQGGGYESWEVVSEGVKTAITEVYSHQSKLLTVVTSMGLNG